MFSKIQAITLKSLENDTHFSFHEDGTTLFSGLETENNGFKEKLAVWVEATKREDKVLKLLQKSLELKTVLKQNDIRRECLTAIINAVKIHAECPQSPHQALAETAYEYLKNSRVKKHSGKDRLTSAIHHIIDDLNQEEFQTLLTSIGMKEVFDQMKASNDEVKKAQRARDHESAKKGVGTVTLARQETDQAYRACMSYVQALLEVMPGTMDDVVNEWNVTINRYRTVLLQRQAIAAKARKKAEAQEGQPPVNEEGNKPSGENKPSGGADGTTTEQNPPKPTDKPAGDKDQQTGTTGQNSGSTGGNTSSEGTGKDDSNSENTGSGPIYTPVSPATEVAVNVKDAVAL